MQRDDRVIGQLGNRYRLLEDTAASGRDGGKLLPHGWWDFLMRNRTTDQLRVGFLGVKPEWQHTGVAALLYVLTDA